MLTDNLQKIVVFTDSQYVRDHVPYAQAWWRNNGWFKSDGDPVENVKLWKDLVREIKNAPHKVKFEWVKGHSSNKHNNAVDKLARQSANGFLLEPLTVQSVRKKLTKQKVRIGSVPMNGQEIDIRIITDKRMKEQKLWRYKYEVLPGTAAHAGCVDIIFSEHLLRAYHSYRVRMSDRTPARIVLVINEIGGKEEDPSNAGPKACAASARPACLPP